MHLTTLHPTILGSVKPELLISHSPLDPCPSLFAPNGYCSVTPALHKYSTKAHQERGWLVEPRSLLPHPKLPAAFHLLSISFVSLLGRGLGGAGMSEDGGKGEVGDLKQLGLFCPC